MVGRFRVTSPGLKLLPCTVLIVLWNVACGGGGSGSPPPPTKVPPTIAKTYGAASVPLNGSTSMMFHLTNPNGSISLSGIGFTDALPAGQIVATPNGLTGSCGGGTITASAGSGSVSLSGATLAVNASCSFMLNVTGTASGTQNNITSVVTSTEAGSGKTATATLIVAGPSQQPPQPVDVSPIDGEVDYILNQLSGLQADLNGNSITPGDHLVQQSRSFTNTSQRWAFAKTTGGTWQISNVRNSFCFDSASISGTMYVVQNPCTGSATQKWLLAPTDNGYYAISNSSTGLFMDVPSAIPGAFLVQTTLSGSATQSQQWLLRPAFFRGVDNALLEKQENARIATGLTWWKDGGVQQDVLQILKNHGVNLVRVRPSSAPPYSNPSQPGFDGGHSASVPPAWAGHTLSQLQSDVYNYVKGELLMFRQAGAMPDLVSIGNEVDTGFLGSLGSPTGSNFAGFASLQIQAMQAVNDAAADTSNGPALPAPLTCLHITPAWDLTDFFTLANNNGIPYDAICQSYYPIFHGPLTPAQAAISNPGNKPIEQNVLTAAANQIGKPILIIETGEHYENGFQANDPWYTPPSPALQAQFLSDLQSVQTALPNNLGMGLAYWDPAGVNIPRLDGGLFNGGTGLPDAIYVWNGLTIFDNADSSGSTNVNDPNYSTPLPALDALGGR